MPPCPHSENGGIRPIKPGGASRTITGRDVAPNRGGYLGDVLDACDLLHVPRSAATEYPHERHPIGHREEGRPIRSAQLGIALRLDGRMCVGQTDVAPAAVQERPLEDEFDRHPLADRVDTKTQDVILDGHRQGRRIHVSTRLGA